VDDCVLQAPGARYLPADDRGIPTGRESVHRSGYDFRAGRAIGATQLDLAFTDLDRDVDGRAWVRLQAPDGRGAAVWLDDGYRYLELFTGDSLPQAQRRRRGLGIEPMTAPPNAFQTGTDVQRLELGETSSASWGARSLRSASRAEASGQPGAGRQRHPHRNTHNRRSVSQTSSTRS